MNIDKLKKIESESTSEAINEYNELISLLILLITSRAKKENIVAKIKELQNKYRIKNGEFAQKVPIIYLEGVKVVSEEIKKKTKINNLGNAEIKRLTKVIEERLNLLVDEYVRRAMSYLDKKEVEKAKSEKYSNYDSTLRTVTSQNKEVEDFEFMDSQGNKMRTNNTINFVYGDILWEAGIAGTVFAMLENAIQKGVHRSIIDKVTTKICRDLDGEERDLNKDQLPPMHPNCRSWIEPIT